MPKALNVLFLDDTAPGPKVAEIGNWPGKAIFSPVQSAGEILKREEFEKPGVYILRSDPVNAAYGERIYIGESGKLRNRLRGHVSRVNQSPFNSFVAFTSTGSLLNKATVKYLEHRLVLLAYENKTSELVNKVSPEMPMISEADVHSMEGYLDQMRLIIPMLGFEFLNPSVVQKKEASLATPTDLFRLKDPRLKAFMYPKEDLLVVTRGSQMRKATSATISKGWIRIRKKLLEQGLLVDKGSCYELTEDICLNSPSAASSILLGRQSPGPRCWIHMSKDQTYGEFIQDSVD